LNSEEEIFVRVFLLLTDSSSHPLSAHKLKKDMTKNDLSGEHILWPHPLHTYIVFLSFWQQVEMGFSTLISKTVDCKVI